MGPLPFGLGWGSSGRGPDDRSLEDDVCAIMRTPISGHEERTWTRHRLHPRKGAATARSPPWTRRRPAHPQPMFKELRDSMPVMAVEGMGVVVTRKVEVDEVFRHPEIFSSNADAVDLKNMRPMIPLQIDPPEHKKYRKILDPIFAPRQMALIEDSVATTVNGLIDGFDRQGRDRLRQGVLGPVPLPGVPDPARPALRGAAAVPDHEGRDHPARRGHRRPVRQPEDGQRLPAGDRRLGLRLLQRGPRPAGAEAAGRHPEPVPRRRGGRGPS